MGHVPLETFLEGMQLWRHAMTSHGSAAYMNFVPGEGGGSRVGVGKHHDQESHYLFMYLFTYLWYLYPAISSPTRQLSKLNNIIKQLPYKISVLTIKMI